MNLKKKINSKGMAITGLLLVVGGTILSKISPKDLVAESIAVVANPFGVILLVLGVYRIIKERVSKDDKHFKKTNEGISIKRNSKIWIAVSVAIVLGLLFYWFSVRPSQIRKQCSMVPMKTYSQERKDEAQKYVDENCQRGKIATDKIADCVINRNILEAPLDGQNQKRSATDKEYAKCLRENGLEDGQSLSNEQLDDLQRGIDDQSAKIDNLQKNNTEQNNNSISQTILESQRKQAEQESANCQQELSEYNACVSEYNAKMAEYNACLAESSNPDSWRYGNGMLCSKPSNYCFKPLCAY